MIFGATKVEPNVTWISMSFRAAKVEQEITWISMNLRAIKDDEFKEEKFHGRTWLNGIFIQQNR